jgi:hypothetical protein
MSICFPVTSQLQMAGKEANKTLATGEVGETLPRLAHGVLSGHDF